uniref:ComF family protein n=1 Tax=Gelidibacter sp. TaxID=2018083 RepID=UPI004049637A
MFPKVCYGCHSFLNDNEQHICTQCRHELPLTNFNTLENNAVEKLLYGRVPIEQATALLWFKKKGIVQHLLHNLKYKGHEDIGLFLGEWLGEELSELKTFQNIDVVVPVPLHKSRQRKRGYNQVHTFAKAIADKLQVEVNTSVLQKTKATETQVFKDRLKRWNDDNTIFSVSNTNDFKGKHILLVDDVITTGATIEACSNALLKIEGIKISVVTMAIAS